MKKFKDVLGKFGKKFEKNDLFKIVLIAILVTVVLTWIIPFGYYSSGEITSKELGRIGIVDIVLSNIYGAQFFLQQIFFIVFLGAFYGILTKVNGYRALVKKIADKLEGKEKFFVLGSSLLITLLTTFLTKTYVVLIFVPFIVNIASRLKLDKITTFLITFGSMLIGIMGATYGTDSLISFVKYLAYYGEVELTANIWVRFGILALAYVACNFFTIKHLSNKKKKNVEVTEDFFEVENPEGKRVKIWPMAVLMIVALVFSVLGYVDWATFKVTIFDKFHTWLTELTIGKYTIISYLLGKNAIAFGTWDLYAIATVLLVMLILAVIIYKTKIDTIIESAIEGIQKVMKPLVLISLTYVLFVVIFWTPFTITISDWILKLAGGFNPYLATASAAITSLFHIDFSYTGYALGDVMINYFGEQFNTGFIVYIAINGLMQFVTPTSAVLLLGLSYLDIPYSKWIKYIWKFVLVMLAILLVIFTLLTYL